MKIDRQQFAEQILYFHKEVDSGIGTKANYPQECDEDWHRWFERQRACFGVLAELADIPIKPEEYWQAVEHFAECLYCETSAEENAEKQALVAKVRDWLKAVESQLQQ